VKPIEPFKITNLMLSPNHIGGSYRSITKAPQNMCYALFNKNGNWFDCVLISIQSKHLCNIANGIKDIEVRKSILNGLKELIK